MTWKISSHSGAEGNCLEADGAWRISNHSMNGDTCVEASATPNRVRVRDTKDRTLPTVSVSGHAWTAFVEEVKTS